MNSPSMSTVSEVWKKWEGRFVGEKFPLRQWLGGSQHSAVFLTEHPGARKAAIKLIAAENIEESAQLSRWAAAAKFSHPHVMQLFDGGSCVIEGVNLLYVVMEYADEDLAQILPVRPLAANEASEMLRPAAEALASLHRAGLAHGGIKPSNIMAVENQLKLSADSLGKIGEHAPARPPSQYDAPEIATGGPSPAGDIWSLGAALVAVLTQHEPKKNGGRDALVVPSTIPQPFRDIARECLRDEPHRCTAEEILRRMQAPAPPAPAREARKIEVPPPQESSKRWVVTMVVVAALVLGVWLGIRLLSRPSPSPVASNPTTAPQSLADTPAQQSPAPFSAKQPPAQKSGAPGRVLQQVMPEVSRRALNTIRGRVKVSVQVQVDTSGKVSEARLVSPGPSKYFASRALAAARQWKFSAPQVGSQPSPSEWLLRFEFGRGSTQVFPSLVKP
jgi:TonB family protein